MNGVASAEQVARTDRVSEPRMWTPVPLGQVLHRHNEIIHPGDRSDGTARFVGLEHIEPHTGRRVGEGRVDFATMTGRKPTFRTGHIVYGYLRPYLNKVWVAEFDGCSSVDQFAFQVNPDLAHTPFVAAFMRSEVFLRRAKGVTTPGQLPRISIDEIEAVDIALPPTFAEQRRIATWLARTMEAANTARQAAAERLAAAEALTPAYIREVFDETHAWPTRPLGEMVEGNGQYGTSQRSNTLGRGLPILGMPHIHEGRIRWRNVSHADMTDGEIAKYRLIAGDILFNRTNSAELVGKTAVFDGDREAVFASYLIRYRAKSGIADPHFISAYVNSRFGRAYIERHMARAVGQVNISASTMHRMPVPCPPYHDQCRIAVDIARRIRAADEVVARCREELAALESIPSALLRDVFGGPTHKGS